MKKNDSEIRKVFYSAIAVMAMFTTALSFSACSSSDSDDDNGSSPSESLSHMRLMKVNSMPIEYDDDAEETSIYTDNWGKTRLSIWPEIEGGYLSQFSEGGETTHVNWSGGNPVFEKGRYFESKATYGEKCNDAAFCTAFNLYALLYGDAYKPHILGVLYGYAYYNKFGNNAKQLVTHVDYHEVDPDEYDDMSCDYEYEKDEKGNVTLITFHVQTTSYKHGELISSKENTETISLTWAEFKQGDYFDGTLYYKIASNKEAQVLKAAKGCKDVKIPETVKIEGREYTVTSIASLAFKDQETLTSVQLPSGIIEIGDSAFVKCSKLATVNLPDALTSISAGAFEGCGSLSTISLPKGLKNINDYAFRSCSKIKTIDIPENVTHIGTAAFENCSSLITINLPNTLTEISSGLLDGCSSLTAITIPSSVTKIGGSAFANCSKIEEIVIPEGVTILHRWTLGGCSRLTTVTLPSTLESLGDLCFTKCTSLRDVYCYAKEPPTIFDDRTRYRPNPFEEASISSATLHVPLASLSKYGKSSPWSGFGTICSIETIQAEY